MQNNSSLISSIHTSRETLLDLMSVQGYDVSEYKDSTLTETNAKYVNEQLDMLFDKSIKEDGTIHKTYVNYHLNKSLRPPYIHDLIDDLFNIEEVLNKKDTLVIVVKEDPHDTIINTLKHLWEREGYFVIVHSIKRLQYNLLNHSLVPPHRIINDAELVELKQKFNMKTTADLPDISRFDPVSLAIGMRPGQVCEIIRPSKTSIKGTYYRVCV
uniref:RNA polymerase subunit H/Rpb5 C-terminal domain-containing protein n=1 Tax=viral metagenome TaxID=1070528 RepID=A0A6C0FCZ4_9ZZZZ|tara:strand:- start:10922 stop:11560 length:639 start_codon:yes stop_codon:yes gene_type:complete